jgi:hypothetical protein
MNNPSIRLISVIGRWDQPLYPPPPPKPSLAELVCSHGPLRPQARLLQQTSRSSHERLR